MFREGDFIEIPLPDGRIAISWIVHISSHFKNAVGIIVFGMKDEHPNNLRIDPMSGLPVSMRVLGPLYTHIGALADYGCKTVGHRPVLDSHRALTKRRVGGNVYVGDECLGSVYEFGEPGLKPMLGIGMPAVFEEIEQAFGARGEDDVTGEPSSH